MGPVYQWCDFYDKLGKYSVRPMDPIWVYVMLLASSTYNGYRMSKLGIHYRHYNLYNCSVQDVSQGHE